MNLNNDIEQALKRLRWKTSDQVDERIIKDAFAALDEALAADGSQMQASFKKRGRLLTMLRSLVTRRPLRAAAAAGLGLTAAVVILLAILASPGLTLAQVKEAVAEQVWVHVKYDNGREKWTCLTDGQTYYRDEGGRIVFTDFVNGLRRTYWPEEGYISEVEMPPYETARTPWDLVVAPSEERSRKAGDSCDVQRHRETVDGRQLVRFDSYFRDIVGTRPLIKQLWADPLTRLPVRTRERLQLAHRQAQKREFITGDYDFPEGGPSSIYELGVPRQAEVVRRETEHAPDSVSVIESGKAARAQFPQRQRAIIWEDDPRFGRVDVIYRDGIKSREERYSYVGPEHPHYHLPVPATAEEVLAWTRTQVPGSISVCDGQVKYNRTGPFPPPFEDQPELTVHVIDVHRSPPMHSTSEPFRFQWPYIDPPGVAMAEPDVDAPAGCVALRRTEGNTRRDYYVDPEHDYICVKEIWWRKRSGDWEKEREYELSDFSLLPTGQWYARRNKLITYGEPGKGISRGGADWNIDVTLLEESDYPADAFDGQALLEGAKVETY